MNMLGATSFLVLCIAIGVFGWGGGHVWLAHKCWQRKWRRMERQQIRKQRREDDLVIKRLEKEFSNIKPPR